MNCFECFNDSTIDSTPENFQFSPRIPDSDSDLKNPELIQEIKAKSKTITSENVKLQPNLVCVTDFVKLMKMNNKFNLEIKHFDRKSATFRMFPSIQ